MSRFDTKDSNLQKFNKLDNYMSKDYTDEDISFSYYGYPNDESEYCLGSIGLLTNKYNILGVTVGDNMKREITKLEKYGFKLEDSGDYLEVTLKYKDFTISMEANLENYEDKENTVIEKIGIKDEIEGVKSPSIFYNSNISNNTCYFLYFNVKYIIYNYVKKRKDI